MTPGYFGDAKATAERFIRLGDRLFFRTGDIGEMRNGKIEIIDRKRSLIKLAQVQFFFVSESFAQRIQGRVCCTIATGECLCRK